MWLQYVRRQIRQRAAEVRQGGKLGVFADDSVASEVGFTASECLAMLHHGCLLVGDIIPSPAGLVLLVGCCCGLEHMNTAIHGEGILNID